MTFVLQIVRSSSFPMGLHSKQRFCLCLKSHGLWGLCVKVKNISCWAGKEIVDFLSAAAWVWADLGSTLILSPRLRCYSVSILPSGGKYNITLVEEHNLLFSWPLLPTTQWGQPCLEEEKQVITRDAVRGQPGHVAVHKECDGRDHLRGSRLFLCHLTGLSLSDDIYWLATRGWGHSHRSAKGLRVNSCLQGQV